MTLTAKILLQNVMTKHVIHFYIDPLFLLFWKKNYSLTLVFMSLPFQTCRVPIMQTFHLFDAQDPIDTVTSRISYMLVSRG